MYQRSYGETHFPDGIRRRASASPTPPTTSGRRACRRWPRPTARSPAPTPAPRIRAGTLEDYAAVVWPRRAELPVVELELGDSWIHGTASDPVKLARFRALQRLYDGFAAEGLDRARAAPSAAASRLVAEHTWGVDIKSYLRDEAAWDRPAFEAARATDPRFAYTEASWAEQRAYLDAAVAALAPADRERAAAGAGRHRAAPPAARPGHGDRAPPRRLADRARPRHRRRPRRHHARRAPACGARGR